ncbi:MAG: tRNA pseudouridine(55) synthase TruB [Candidatus Krumholzibacteriia bacterium]
MTAPAADGFLLVDKPAGVTSFRIVDHVRKALLRAQPGLQARRGGGRPGGPRPPRFKCGHTGTLDPMATGLLVVMTGKGSRLVPFLTGLDKTYLATVRFGTETHTLDAEGEVTATAAPPATAARAAAALDAFRGDILQVPPLVSALKRDGKPLYARVRAGEDLAEPDPRPVRVDRLEVTGARWPGPQGEHELDLEVSCGSGFYVRSLARDLGRAVGSCAHLVALRRLRVGPFAVADALAGVLDRDGAALMAALRPCADAVPWAAALRVGSDEAALLAHGGQPAADWLERLPAGEAPPAPDGLVRLLDPDGALVAVAAATPDGLRTAAVLAAADTADTTDAGEGRSPCA